jgi:branched-chain amino acid transport system substrate-binding protein
MMKYRKSLLASACAVLAASTFSTAPVAKAAETKGPVTDDVGVLVIPKGAPIQIGAYWVMSGADSALGIDEKRGVEIAIKNQGGSVVGHPIKLSVEDDLCNAEGGQTAATKLAANPNTAIVLGPACSAAATPGAPILWKAGITDIATATTAPKLTAPDRKPEYDGYMRTVYSDIDQGAADAKYVHDVLKAEKIVTIHDGSPYAQQLATVMGDNFKKLGGTVLSQEAVAPTDVDMHPVLTRIATEKPDVIYAPVFVAAGAQLLRQEKETPGLEKVMLIGSSGQMAPDLIEAARDAVVGYRITYPDVSPEAMGSDYPKFADAYKADYGEAPISGYHANAYDAAELAFKAIEKVAKTDSSGATYIGRKALRDAVLSIKFDGVSGPIACDEHGQCAKFKPAVYEFTNGDPKTFKIGENPKKVWP